MSASLRLASQPSATVPTHDTLQTEFKAALRRLATTVAIVTAGRDGERVGMAATAVTSVSADPPTILIAVNHTASISPHLVRNGWFCVNLLAERHAPLVGVFGGGKTGAERFLAGEWVDAPEGMPILADAAASLICRTSSTLDIATHAIFVGTVTRIQTHARIAPLIWVDGRLGCIDTITAIA